MEDNITGSASVFERHRLDNGLWVCVACNPGTKMAGVALSVESAGYEADPPDLPGLTHLLEHVLVTRGDLLDRMAVRCGGTLEAVTDAQRTVFRCGLEVDALADAVALLFDALVVRPDTTFDRDMIRREIRVVDEECARDATRAGCRINQLLRATAPHDHPFARFARGDAHTLDTVPRGNGIDVAVRLASHHRAIYGTAACVRICVFAREPLPALLRLVAHYFRAWPAGPPQTTSPSSPPGPPFRTEQGQRWYDVADRLLARWMLLVFPLTVRSSDPVVTTALEWVAENISCDWLRCLRSRGLADTVEVERGITGADWSMFVVAVGLITPDGTEPSPARAECVVDDFFRWMGGFRLRLARTTAGDRDWFAREWSHIGDAKALRSDPAATPADIGRLCDSLLTENGTATTEWDDAVIAGLSPRNVRVYHISAGETAAGFVPPSPSRFEPPPYPYPYGGGRRFACGIRRRSIGPDTVKRWEDSVLCDTAAAGTAVRVSRATPPPRVLSRWMKRTAGLNPLTLCCLETDAAHGTEVSVRWYVRFPGASRGPRRQALSQLWATTVAEAVRRADDKPGDGGVEIVCTSEGLLAYGSGDTAAAAFAVVRALGHPDPAALLRARPPPRMTMSAVRTRTRRFRADRRLDPRAVVSDATDTFLDGGGITSDDIDDIDDGDDDELRRFVSVAHRDCRWVGLSVGPVGHRSEVVAMVAELRGAISVAHRPPSIPSPLPLPLSRWPNAAPSVRFLLCTGSGDLSAAQAVAWAGRPTPRGRALSMVAAAAARGQCFRRLRTHETLGYAVDLEPFVPADASFVGIVCRVVSAAYSPHFLLVRIRAFMDTLGDFFGRLNPDVLRRVVRTVTADAEREQIARLRSDPMNSVWESMIGDGTDTVLQAELPAVIAEMQTLQTTELANFARRYLSGDNVRCLAALCEGHCVKKDYIW